PAVDGADGVSELSRQVVRALAGRSGVPSRGGVEVWTLDGGSSSSLGDGVMQRSAHGNRAVMVAWTIGQTLRPLHGVTVIVTHVHLAPFAAALALRGARVVVFLVGVE